jgi:hypothetical protein
MVVIIQKIEDYFLIKVYKECMGDIDLFDMDGVQDLFQKIFLKIRDKYELSGLIEVEVYVHGKYGMIIEIRPICNYFDEVDVKIHVHLDSTFLVCIDALDILDYEEVYYYQDKFYGVYTKMSDSEILYKDIEEILDQGIKIC